MILSQDDEHALDRCCESWQRFDELNGWVDIVLHGYQLPSGLAPASIDLLLRLPSQFPDAVPDMFWAIPDVTVLRTGGGPPNTEVHETHVGRIWQRFSRHLSPGAWQIGVDGLPSWLATILRSLQRDAA